MKKKKENNIRIIKEEIIYTLYYISFLIIGIAGLFGIDKTRELMAFFIIAWALINLYQIWRTG